MVDRLKAHGGICSYGTCEEKRVSKYHAYCLDHRRLVARQSQYRRYHKSRLTPRPPDAGDSAASQTLSPQSGESTPEVNPAATQRG